jgi:hypothetical protein
MWQFYKLDVGGKLVAIKLAVSYAVRHQLMTPLQQQEKKASISRDVNHSKDPRSNRNASFKQGAPAGEGTTSTAKTPATAGSV